LSSLKKEKTKALKIIEGADKLSLGISMVVAVGMGFALGLGLRALFGYEWLLWLGIFWGVAAAGLNIYKAYLNLRKEMRELENDPRYKNRTYQRDPDDDDD
jgi:hypothetical protein